MPKYTRLPPITGKELIKLLQKDGWTSHGHTRHGISMRKMIGGRTRVTFIQNTSGTLPDGTLADILGPQQTGISKKGLLELANKYGI